MDKPITERRIIEIIIWVSVIALFPWIMIPVTILGAILFIKDYFHY